jgi:hypothetical protein
MLVICHVGVLIYVPASGSLLCSAQKFPEDYEARKKDKLRYR